MKLEKELKLNPENTLLLVIDVQRDFLETMQGFVFQDAGDKPGNMQEIVRDNLVPLIERSLKAETHVAYVKSEYPRGRFPPPYDRLCSKSPGQDLYLIDKVNGSVKVFVKNEPNTFSNVGLGAYIEDKDIMSLVVSGVTLTSCVDTAIKSAICIPNLEIIVPEDCIGYRKKREEDARKILDGYRSMDKKRIKVVNSSQILYST